MKKIFISYRRDGGEYLAGRIYDYLIANEISAFYDVESLHTGKFNEQLYHMIDNSDYFLMILSPNALDRCSDENDWFRLEIARAIQLNKPIIPIMMPEFKFPDNLPEDIKNVSYYQGLVINNALFKEQMNRLLYMMGIDPNAKIAPEKKHSFMWGILILFIIVSVSVFAIFMIRFFATDTENRKNTTNGNSSSSVENQITNPSHEQLIGICTSTSTYKPVDIYTYFPHNVFDYDNNTAWVENVNGNGIGEKLSVEFNKPITIKKIELVNGYSKNERSYYKNNRAKAIDISLYSSDSKYAVTLAPADIYLQPTVHDFKTACTDITRIDVTLADNVYPGEEDDDTAITDIFLYDESNKLIVFKATSKKID